MTLRFEDLRVRDSDQIDRDFFNRRMRLIAETFSQFGGQITAVEDTTNRLLVLGLNRVNEILGPALAKVQLASENGFLVATSATELTLVDNLETTLVIDDGAARDLFAATPFLMLTRHEGGDVNDWALIKTQTYNRENGGLAFEVLAVSGAIEGVPISGWVISASAGLGRTILEAVGVIDETLVLAQAAAIEAAAAAAAATAILASGPVSSVNGKAGVVLLVQSDIPGLTAAIAAKADSSHGHTIANISGLATALDNIDGGTY